MGGMGGRSLVVFQGRKVGLFNFPRNLFFGGLGWGVWRKKVGIFFFVFFLFCDMVT